MGQWSPENIGALILGPNQIPVVGMVFDGYNKRGRLKWRTRCKVTAAQPNVSFAFKVLAFGYRRPFLRFPIPTTWSYSFRTLDEQSTLVTETWTVGPWPPLLMLVLRGCSADGINVVEMQRRNLRITLQNLKQRLEAEQNDGSVQSEPSSGAAR
jgi:hypothetical protein